MQAIKYNANIVTKEYNIQVQVHPDYLPLQSDPENQQYVFAYTVTLSNVGNIPANLLSRHWIITNGDGEKEEVKGAGVVGEYPHLNPGQSYRYTSGSVLKTPVGTMVGSYQMRAEDGTLFEAEIPLFTLKAFALH